MRRCVLFLFLVCLLAASSACSPKRATDDTINFYYVRAEYNYGQSDSVICPEARKYTGYADNLNALISHYLQGPESTALKLLFPQGTRSVNVTVSESTLYITLSDNVAALAPADITIACHALAYTCLEVLPVDAVSISTQTKMLNAKSTILIDRSSSIFIDDITVSPEASVPG